MKVFLTGGTGFIGSYIVKLLSKNGFEVTILARNPNKVPELKSLKGVTIIQGGIEDLDTIRKYMKNQDICIHVALHWGDSAREMLLNDTQSSVTLFELAAESGVREIIYTSSTAVNDSIYMDPDAVRSGEDMNVYEHTKQRPVTFYGATKGASELYLNAVAFKYKLKANIVRPGYTFGSPVVEGGSIQSDRRFHDIVERVAMGRDVEIIKNDGTQFIWAGHLAEIYLAILKSNVRGKMYFGLGNRFITWEEIAAEAISRLNSKSTIILRNLGWSDKPALFDVSAIRKDFGFSFDAWRNIQQHIDYLGKIITKS
jgi:UDP-glucose 4-epimerase